MQLAFFGIRFVIVLLCCFLRRLIDQWWVYDGRGIDYDIGCWATKKGKKKTLRKKPENKKLSKNFCLKKFSKVAEKQFSRAVPFPVATVVSVAYDHAFTLHFHRDILENTDVDVGQWYENKIKKKIKK